MQSSPVRKAQSQQKLCCNDLDGSPRALPKPSLHRTEQIYFNLQEDKRVEFQHDDGQSSLDANVFDKQVFSPVSSMCTDFEVDKAPTGPIKFPSSFQNMQQQGLSKQENYEAICGRIKILVEEREFL